MIKYKSDKNILKFLIVISILLLICIIIAIIYYLYFKIACYKDCKWIIRIVAFSLITTYAALAFVMLPMWYRSLCYFVSSEKIIIESGIFVKKRIYVRTDQIQYVTVIKCARLFKNNINILLINVYGKRIIIPFLSLHDMEEINKIIHSQLEGKSSL